jgi:hypothetical protein
MNITYTENAVYVSTTPALCCFAYVPRSYVSPALATERKQTLVY